MSRDYIDDPNEDIAFSLRAMNETLHAVLEVLERIAKAAEGPTEEERLAADYKRSAVTLQEAAHRGNMIFGVSDRLRR